MRLEHQVASLQQISAGWWVGDLLVEEGLLNALQLQVVLLEQSRTGLPVEEILLARGWVAAADLVGVLARWRRVSDFPGLVRGEGHRHSWWVDGSAFALGRLLVERGRISEQQLEQALAEQERSGLRLGEILRDLGAVSDRELAEALAEQQGKRADLAAWSRAQADEMNQALAEDESEQNPPESWFELHEVERGPDTALYASPRFLDTVDVAFAVLSEWWPERLEIITSNGRRREVCWRYPTC